MVGGGSVDDEEGGAHDLSDANGGGGISEDERNKNSGKVDQPTFACS